MKQQLIDFLRYIGFDDEGDLIHFDTCSTHKGLTWLGLSWEDDMSPAEFVDAYLEQLRDVE